jgi:hypothetical protein
MDPSTFDNLTKALATSTSRRQALRRLGGALSATLLASWPFGQALAQGGGNSDCAHFCNAIFGVGTPAAGQCTSDAAHHKGLCYTCGPASSGGTRSICCPKNSSGYCSSYSSATCCDSGKTCLSGSCCATANVCGSTCLATPCKTSQCQMCDPTMGTCVGCPSSQTCLNGSCCPNDQVCGSSCGCPQGQTCQNGTCVPQCSVLLGFACTSASQCCDTGQGKTTCGTVSVLAGTFCCNESGGVCSHDLDCCGSAGCDTSVTPPVCR